MTTNYAKWEEDLILYLDGIKDFSGPISDAIAARKIPGEWEGNYVPPSDEAPVVQPLRPPSLSVPQFTVRSAKVVPLPAEDLGTVADPVPVPISAEAKGPRAS